MTMKKEKHSFLGFLIREWYYRLRRELFTAKGWVVLIFLGYVVFCIVTEQEGERYATSSGIVGYWFLLLFPIRLGKLFYMLPFGKEEQKRYIIDYCLTSLLYVTVVLSLFGCLVMAFLGKSCFPWLMGIVLRAFPLWLSALSLLLMERNKGVLINFGCFTTRTLAPDWETTEAFDLDAVRNEYEKYRKQELSTEEKREKRRGIAHYSFLVIVLILTMMNSFLESFGSGLSAGTFSIVSGLVSYVLAISSILTVFQLCFREIDASKERKEGGDGCSF